MVSNDSMPRVVVGLDGSPSSYAALRWAVKQAKLIGGVVDAVTGWEAPNLYGWNAPVVDTRFDEEVAERKLTQELHEVLGEDRPVEVRARVVRGHPVEALLDAARGAELVVLGSRGRGSFASALLGSVSHAVAQHATCPVVIVRPD